MGFNRVMFEGEVASDLAPRAVGDDKTVCDFRLKVNRDYFTITVWDKLALECVTKLTKGSRVLISGYAKNDSWEKEGVKQYRTKFVAQEVVFLDGSGSTELPATF